MSDFYEKHYYINNIREVPVYTLNNQGQLVKSDQTINARLVVKVEEKPVKSVFFGTNDEKIKIWIQTVFHPQALVLDIKGVSITDKSWIVDIQEIIQLNNIGSAGFYGYGLSAPHYTPAQFERFTLESISDPQPDYDADFVTVSLEGNGLIPAHGPVTNGKSVYLNFSPNNLSVFNWNATPKAFDVADIAKFGETIKSIDQDNLMVTLKSQRTDLTTAPSYRIPVLMTK